MPVTVLDANGLGQDSDVIAGVIWAADHGADVIVMAFSNPGFSQNLQDALDSAWSKKVVLVAATGNEAVSTPTFPAGDRGVMGVSGTDPNDALAPFSNSGPSVFIAAPATDIQTTTTGDAYTVISGTSASAAIVAGAAAFMKAVDPTLSNGVIVGRLARMAEPAGTQDQTGNGRINMARALADTGTDFIQPAGAPPVSAGGPFVGPYVAAALSVKAVAVGSQSGSLTYGTVGSGTYSITFTTNGSGSAITVNLTVTGVPRGGSGKLSSSSISCTGGTPNCPSVTLTVTTTSLAAAGAATFTVTATSAANANDKATGTGTLTISKANTTTTITTDLSAATVVGQGYAVSVTVAKVSGSGATPTGTVTISDGTASCMPALSGGTASCTLTSTTAGSKTITATYSGDTNFNTSPGTASHTVNPANTTTAITNAATLATATVVGQSYAVNYSVTVNSPGSGTPTGTVTVSDGTSTCTGTVAAGTCSLTSTTAGAKTITAT